MPAPKNRPRLEALERRDAPAPFMFVDTFGAAAAHARIGPSTDTLPPVISTPDHARLAAQAIPTQVVDVDAADAYFAGGRLSMSFETNGVMKQMNDLMQI